MSIITTVCLHILPLGVEGPKSLSVDLTKIILILVESLNKAFNRLREYYKLLTIACTGGITTIELRCMTIDE